MTGQLHQATCVAIRGRGVLIEGRPGSGKSSLALALIDRGAVLVGDDGVMIAREGDVLIASPAPAIAGKLEVRNVGLLSFPTVARVPVALVIGLDPAAPRFRDAPAWQERLGCRIPAISLWPDSPILALRAELALRTYGLP
ncbi:HPr kinase/phosphorylase [Novosphingobium sp. Gsoil 351]|uniref:HPr kinase/phosphorylase n=1 Tax=Novosphingobium sp. Gsoil 351 TaxID=2675225 RepID=UPI0012B470AF|nr:HPr kinase/phosphatase C-terminal domain-containing protein [Novosphingobium sp. Gsoil 351]QGN53292.1 serine kinase [Novosphingobium sp. Gsoil 351]